jgi:UDP-glucose 4-epimerase
MLLRAARTRAPLPVRDFINRRSLISIDNFVSALDFVLSTAATLGETYVVADPGIPPRLGDLIATMRRAQGRRPLLLPLPPHYLETPLRLMRRDGAWERLGGNLRIDAAKLIAAGWQPLHDTRGGLTALVETLSNRRGGT